MSKETLNTNNAEIPTKKTAQESETRPETKEPAWQLLENWPMLTGAEKGDYSEKELSQEQIKKELYEKLSPAIEKAVDSLGIKIDQSLLGNIEKSEKIEEKMGAQKAFIESLMGQLVKIPFDKWGFSPDQIKELKKTNCSGSSLILGHILKKYGIEAYYGIPAGHAVNVIKLTDESLWYADSRNSARLQKIDGAQMQGNKPQIIKIQQGDIRYQLMMVAPQEYAVSSILNNFEALKGAVEKDEPEDFSTARNIYNKSASLIYSIKPGEISSKLYPEITDYRNSGEFQIESKRIEESEASLKKLRSVAQEELSKLNPQIKEMVEKEISENQGLISEFWASELPPKQLSPETIEFLTKMKSFEKSLKDE